MTKPLDTKIIPKVLEILTKYGMSITMVEISGGTYDPATGENTGETTTDHSVKIAPPSPGIGYIINDLVKEGDMETTIATSGLTIDFDNQLEFTLDSKKWKVIHHTPMYSGDSIAAYQLLLRQ